MSILNNEGHDPLGFGNVLSRTDASDLAAATLRAETFERQYRQACQDHAMAMAQIERLRTSLGKLYWQLQAYPVKHPQQGDDRAEARDLLDAAD